MSTRRQGEQVKLYGRAGTDVRSALGVPEQGHLKNFSINMGLSLVGIGAMLRSEDGYAKLRAWFRAGPPNWMGD